MSFEKELEQLINKYSKENDSNTPDFILANYIISCLENFNRVVNARENWYGRITVDPENSSNALIDSMLVSLASTEKLSEDELNNLMKTAIDDKGISSAKELNKIIDNGNKIDLENQCHIISEATKDI